MILETYLCMSESFAVYTIMTQSIQCSQGIYLNFLTLYHSIKVVLGGYRRCPDSHALSECHHLYELGRHI